MSKRKEQYNANKQAKVHTKIVCPICGKEFEKIQYSQAFCSSKCKDDYWNTKGDRHKNPNYHREYNIEHPERFERVGLQVDDKGNVFPVEYISFEEYQDEMALNSMRDEDFDYCDW